MNIDLFMSRAVELLPASAASCFLVYVARRALKEAPSPRFTIALWLIGSWFTSSLLMVLFDTKPSAVSSWPLGLVGAVVASTILHASSDESKGRMAQGLEPTSALVRRYLMVLVVAALGIIQCRNTLFDAAGFVTVFGPMTLSMAKHPAFPLTFLNLVATFLLLNSASWLWARKSGAPSAALLCQAVTIVVPLVAWFVYWAMLGSATDAGERAYPMLADYLAQRAWDAFWVSAVAVVAIVSIKGVRVSFVSD